MLISIDVPEDTKAVSVTSIFGNADNYTMSCRSFLVTDGVVADENDSNKVVPEGKE